MAETKFNGRFWQAWGAEYGQGFFGVGNSEKEAIDDLNKWAYPCRGDCCHINESVICRSCGFGADYKYQPQNGFPED